MDRSEGRVAALNAAAPIVARIKDEDMRKRYAISLDRGLGLMDERFVLERVRAHAGPDQARISRQAPPRAPELAGRRPAGSVPRGGPGMAADRAGGGGEGPAGRPGAGPEGNGGVRHDPRDPVVQVEREALKLAVQRPGLCGPGFAALGADPLPVPAPP